MRDRKLLLASIGILIGLALIGGALVSTAIVAGVLIFAGFWLLAQKSAVISWFIRTFPLITDATVTIGSYFMLSGIGITAILASAVVGILTTGYVARERLRHAIGNPEGRQQCRA